jgi:N-acetylglucosamine-6-phosphate deacetylase
MHPKKKERKSPQFDIRSFCFLFLTLVSKPTSSITLLECVNNFLQWTGTGIPHALKAVTATPAAMLGLQGVKGSLAAGADADLVIFSEAQTPGRPSTLVLDEVWKFGTRVHRASAI